MTEYKRMPRPSAQFIPFSFQNNLDSRVHLSEMMATMAITRVAIVLLIAVALTVGRVQGGRPNPDVAFPDHLVTVDPPNFRNPHGRHQSSTWASSWVANQAAEGVFQQPREYNYAMDDTQMLSEEFFTPEELARIRAYNIAQQAKAHFESQRQFQEPVKTTTTTASTAAGNNHQYYPKIFPDGTELLWVDEPRMTTPEEMARAEQSMGGVTSSTALPEPQRNQVNDAFSTRTYNYDGSNDATISTSYNNP